ALAVYIAQQVPAINVAARTSTVKPISVSSHLRLGTVSFQDVDVVSPPAVGTLSAFNGTEATYTPPNGFTGQVTFSYRGRRTTPSSLLGDPRTVTIDVSDTASLLTISKSGNGTGLVSSAPMGLSCGATCTDAFPEGSKMTLTALPSFGSHFVSWGNVTCDEGVNTDGTCSIVLGSADSLTVTAQFALDKAPTLLPFD